jgi:hypothetical protein
MEITIESIIGIMGLLLGGGSGAFFTWRWQKRKAKAEAEKEEQGYYQQMMKDIAADRDYYKQERNDLRQTIKQYDARIDGLERAVARNGRMVEAMRPFLCADMTCKLRKRVVLSECEGVDAAATTPLECKEDETKEIEPINIKDM